MSLAQQFLPELEQEADTTRRLLARVPRAHLGWRPHSRSMTLGQLALHVAEVPEAFARILTPDGIDFAQADFRTPEPAADIDLAAVLDRRRTRIRLPEQSRHSHGLADSCRHRRVRVLRPVHRAALAGRGTPRRYADQPADSQQPLRGSGPGPETFTYRELAATVGRIIGARRPIVSVPPPVGYWIGRAVGLLVRDVVVTREEIEGLMAGLLCVDGPPTGTTRLTVWAEQHKHTLGLRYSSELARRAPSSGGLP